MDSGNSRINSSRRVAFRSASGVVQRLPGRSSRRKPALGIALKSIAYGAYYPGTVSVRSLLVRPDDCVIGGRRVVIPSTTTALYEVCEMTNGRKKGNYVGISRRLGPIVTAYPGSSRPPRLEFAQCYRYVSLRSKNGIHGWYGANNGDRIALPVSGRAPRGWPRVDLRGTVAVAESGQATALMPQFSSQSI
ncbi:hypothetical protein B0G80_6040 [Paraburkholderia sp. BL6669N2]|nr:hypothetical protein B0G80_6040 [Paraburkholderia sp. BL6669N2]